MISARSIRTGVSWTCLGAIVVFAVACAPGSGNVVTKNVPVASFSTLEVDSAFNVAVSRGKQEKLTLQVDDNLVDRVDLRVSDGKLRLGLKSGTSVRKATLHADVTALRLSGIDVTGASMVHLSSELAGRKLRLTASGAGRLDGRVRFDEVQLDLSGASHIELAGSARRIEVQESGASDLNAAQLEARDLDIELSGASSATASVSGTISADLSGASSLRHWDSPRFVRRKLSGGSSITRL